MKTLRVIVGEDLEKLKLSHIKKKKKRIVSQKPTILFGCFKMFSKLLTISKY